MKKTAYGFTIVELLIVIVVIAILASISIVAYTGVQERARQSKIDSDIRAILTAIQAARINASQNLITITGSNYTAGGCTSKPAGTNLAALPDTDACITRYQLSLNAISAASGVQLGDIRDPWGRPYLIDENEGESGGCVRDTVAAYAQPFSGSTRYPTTPPNNVPLGGFTGCS